MLVFVSYAGDILTLKNEMIFEGKVIKIKDCGVVFKANDNSYVIPATDIFHCNLIILKTKFIPNT